MMVHIRDVPIALALIGRRYALHTWHDLRITSSSIVRPEILRFRFLILEGRVLKTGAYLEE